VRWFEAEPTYIYHVVNAWEEEGAVVMDACRTLDPLAARAAGDGPLARMLAVLKQEARLSRWRFDLHSGGVREETLDDRNAEFPSIDARRVGRPTRCAYLARIARAEPTLLFDALIKYDTASGGSDTWECGPGRFASEAPFAPRAGAVDEDDGFLVSIVCDAASGRSEVAVLDARDLARGPVARVLLPQRVPVGFHACFVRGDQLPS
jgi:carotenoid cleavage dioxygenase